MAETATDYAERVRWFCDARFGMFIHWGAYAVAARGEWVMCDERIPFEQYKGMCADAFDPVHYDPRQWVELAQRAGMKYMVLTTKHHDGYCLFDTETTDYNAVKGTPGRDLVAEYVEACREAGMRIGFYFSLVDWSHPLWRKHCDIGNIETWRPAFPDADQREHNEYVHRQVRELCTNYGPIDLMWYDGCRQGAEAMESEKLNAMVRELQPGIMINNRSGLPEDIDTPEQRVQASDEGRAWESCMTMNMSWGYHAGDNLWKPTTEILRLLFQCATGGGNLLLNVGPKADGTIPAESVLRLEEVGRWLADRGEALYGTRRGPGPVHAGWRRFCYSTRREGVVYIFMPRYPGGTFEIFPEGEKIRAASLLGEGRDLEVATKKDRVVLTGLPEQCASSLFSIVKLELA